MSHASDALHPTQRFSSRAGDYALYRPSYPSALAPLLEREVGLTPSSVLADVGAGTGILTEILLDHGNTVFAVEPNPEMRRQAEDRLGTRPGFHSIAAAAETTTLPDASVDGVLVAQAFHWFDQGAAVREFRRIVRPGGFVALIWNVRKTGDSPFMIDYDRIVAAHGSDFTREARHKPPEQAMRDLSALFASEVRLHVLPNFQDLDWTGVRGRLMSTSYMPLPGQSGHDAMLAELRAAFDRDNTGGIVRIDYDTRVYLAGAGGGRP